MGAFLATYMSLFAPVWEPPTYPWPPEVDCKVGYDINCPRGNAPVIEPHGIWDCYPPVSIKGVGGL